MALRLLCGHGLFAFRRHGAVRDGYANPNNYKRSRPAPEWGRGAAERPGAARFFEGAPGEAKRAVSLAYSRMMQRKRGLSLGDAPGSSRSGALSRFRAKAAVRFASSACAGWGKRRTF